MSGKPIIALGSWGEHEPEIYKMIKVSEGILEAGELSQIGLNLRQLFFTQELKRFVENLYINLRHDSPIPYDWKKRYKETLDDIKTPTLSKTPRTPTE